MPFRSKAQRRFFHWAEAHGKLPKGKTQEWEDETPKDKELPERVKEASMLHPAFIAGFEKDAQIHMNISPGITQNTTAKPVTKAVRPQVTMQPQVKIPANTIKAKPMASTLLKGVARV